MDSILCYPYGKPLIGGLLKSTPEDFRVTEQLGFSPDGEGEHLFLFIEKISLTTPELVDQLARDFAIHPRQISHSGLKDKQAVTRQWIGLHLPGEQAHFRFPEMRGYRLLEYGWHGRKLRPGTHKWNDFAVCLRAVDALPAGTEVQLQQLQAQGFANYFGGQRFGRQHDNVERALQQLGRRKLSRQRKSIYISALRSDLFNRVLAGRIADGHWEQPVCGDVFMLRGSHSIFSEKIDAALVQRYQSLDISSTGSLYGIGEQPLTDDAAAYEELVFSAHPNLTRCLREQAVKRQLRSLRAVAENMVYRYDENQRTLTIELRLPAGSYLTTFLDHFIDAREVHPSTPGPA